MKAHFVKIIGKGRKRRHDNAQCSRPLNGAFQDLFCSFYNILFIVIGRSLFRDIAAGWPQWLATLMLVAIQVT